MDKTPMTPPVNRRMERGRQPTKETEKMDQGVMCWKCQRRDAQKIPEHGPVASNIAIFPVKMCDIVPEGERWQI